MSVWRVRSGRKGCAKDRDRDQTPKAGIIKQPILTEIGKGKEGDKEEEEERKNLETGDRPTREEEERREEKIRGRRVV